MLTNRVPRKIALVGHRASGKKTIKMFLEDHCGYRGEDVLVLTEEEARMARKQDPAIAIVRIEAPSLEIAIARLIRQGHSREEAEELLGENPITKDKGEWDGIVEVEEGAVWSASEKIQGLFKPVEQPRGIARTRTERS